MKICIFFDGQNFYRSLQRYDETLRVDYDRLATWITQAVGGPAAMFGGAYYYVGVSADAPPLVEGFLKGLELRPGYFVKREPRVRRTGRCPACGAEYEYTTEKRVDTRLVADLIHYAANGAYDAAVLVSGDDDFVPAVEAVNALGKQVWVATWSAEELSTDLRVRCFGHIHLSEGVGAFRVERLPRDRDARRAASAPTAAAVRVLARAHTGRRPAGRRRTPSRARPGRAAAGGGAAAAREPRLLRHALEVAPAAARRPRARAARPADARRRARRGVRGHRAPTVGSSSRCAAASANGNVAPAESAPEPRHDAGPAAGRVRGGARRSIGVPPDVVASVRLRTLDILGIALAASTGDSAPSVLGALDGWAAGGDCTVIGGQAHRGRARWPSSPTARWRTASTSTTRTRPRSRTPPRSWCRWRSRSVRRGGLDGRAVITAAVAGYEAITRLGMAAPGAFHARGWHATAVCGPFAAALVAGRLDGPRRRPAHRRAGHRGQLRLRRDGVPRGRLVGEARAPGWAGHGGAVAAALARRRLHGAGDDPRGALRLLPRPSSARARIAAPFATLGTRVGDAGRSASSRTRAAT